MDILFLVGLVGVGALVFYVKNQRPRDKDTGSLPSWIKRLGGRKQ